MNISLIQFLPDSLDKVIDLLIAGQTVKAVAILVVESERLKYAVTEAIRREQD